MDGRRVPGSAGSNRGGGHRRPKASPGLHVVERDGFFHIVGTFRAGGRSVRVRKSTGLPATDDNREAAETLRLEAERQGRNEAVHGIKPSVPFAVAADQYLQRPRDRPLNGVDVARIQELTKHFGIRVLNTIPEADWHRFIDRRCAKVQPQTRERYLSLLFGFLRWCADRPRCWLTAEPYFARDRKAKKRRSIARRRAPELTPDLVCLLIDQASPHLAAQLAVEWSTGARVSSILFGCRLCDLNLAPGRESITFQRTKTGEPVTASLHPWTAGILRKYIEWRGNLNDREGPLFLTHRKEPYSVNPKVSGGQNKTAFVAARRRAVQYLLRMEDEASHTKAELLGQVTQHWFRHALATQLFASGADVKTVMEQGGWLDPHSALAYAHDVPDRRRELVNSLPTPGTPQADTQLPRDRGSQKK